MWDTVIVSVTPESPSEKSTRADWPRSSGTLERVWPPKPKSSAVTVYTPGAIAGSM